jgi:hypothetical protein
MNAQLEGRDSEVVAAVFRPPAFDLVFAVAVDVVGAACGAFAFAVHVAFDFALVAAGSASSNRAAVDVGFDFAVDRALP